MLISKTKQKEIHWYIFISHIWYPLYNIIINIGCLLPFQTALIYSIFIVDKEIDFFFVIRANFIISRLKQGIFLHNMAS